MSIHWKKTDPLVPTPCFKLKIFALFLVDWKSLSYLLFSQVLAFLMLWASFLGLNFVFFCRLMPSSTVQCLHKIVVCPLVICMLKSARPKWLCVKGVSTCRGRSIVCSDTLTFPAQTNSSSLDQTPGGRSQSPHTKTHTLSQLTHPHSPSISLLNLPPLCHPTLMTGQRKTGKEAVIPVMAWKLACAAGLCLNMSSPQHWLTSDCTLIHLC